MDWFVILLLVALHVVLAVVTALKGKPWFLLFGLVIGWFWLFGALRLAKPHSWWAHKFYGPAKQMSSRIRFGDDREPETAPASGPPAARY